MMDEIVLTGLKEVLRSGTQYSALPHTKFQDDHQKVVYCSGLHYAPCNGVIEKSKNRDFKEAEVQKIIDEFQSKKVPFVWWTDNSSLEKKGFQFGGTMKGIVLDLAENQSMRNQSTSSACPTNLTIKIVQNEEELDAFAFVVAECSGFGSELREKFKMMSRSAMKHQEQIHFLAYIHDIPIATATLTTTPISAGIWNFCTLPQYRRQGVGTALSVAAIQEAKKKNYQHVMALLMPKGLAWNLFRYLGFKETCSLPFYVFGANADELEK